MAYRGPSAVDLSHAGISLHRLLLLPCPCRVPDTGEDPGNWGPILLRAAGTPFPSPPARGPVQDSPGSSGAGSRFGGAMFAGAA